MHVISGDAAHVVFLGELQQGRIHQGLLFVSITLKLNIIVIPINVFELLHHLVGALQIEVDGDVAVVQRRVVGHDDLRQLAT